MDIRRDDVHDELDREPARTGEPLPQVEELEEAWAALSCGCDSTGDSA